MLSNLDQSSVVAFGDHLFYGCLGSIPGATTRGVSLGGIGLPIGQWSYLSLSSPFG